MTSQCLYRQPSNKPTTTYITDVAMLWMEQLHICRCNMPTIIKQNNSTLHHALSQVLTNRNKATNDTEIRASLKKQWRNVPVEGTVSGWQAVHCGWMTIWFQHERLCDTSLPWVYCAENMQTSNPATVTIQNKRLFSNFHFRISRFTFKQLAFVSVFWRVYVMSIILHIQSTAWFLLEFGDSRKISDVRCSDI